MFRQQGHHHLKFRKHRHPIHLLRPHILFRCKECLNQLWDTATCLQCLHHSIHMLLCHHPEVSPIPINLAFLKHQVNYLSNNCNSHFIIHIIRHTILWNLSRNLCTSNSTRKLSTWNESTATTRSK